mmetsp:Transcript_115565/g.327494  ORF Transcript_115565/g.327494 Transcript_115565/m.327494 type:complete len:345 (-) Transcript_115565:142-1176(-)
MPAVAAGGAGARRRRLGARAPEPAAARGPHRVAPAAAGPARAAGALPSGAAVAAGGRGPPLPVRGGGARGLARGPPALRAGLAGGCAAALAPGRILRRRLPAVCAVRTLARGLLPLAAAALLELPRLLRLLLEPLPFGREELHARPQPRILLPELPLRRRAATGGGRRRLHYLGGRGLRRARVLYRGLGRDEGLPQGPVVLRGPLQLGPEALHLGLPLLLRLLGRVHGPGAGRVEQRLDLPPQLLDGGPPGRARRRRLRVPRRRRLVLEPLLGDAGLDVAPELLNGVRHLLRDLGHRAVQALDLGHERLLLRLQAADAAVQGGDDRVHLPALRDDGLLPVGALS